jgi:hypothetical protein
MSTGRNRTWTWIPGLALAGALALFSWGCGDDALSGSAGTTGTAGSDATLALAAAPPSVDDLAGVLDLTPEQEAALGELLETWQAAHEERRGQVGRQRGGRFGQGGGPGRPADGEAFQNRERPMQSFLSGAAEILDTAQMTALVEYLGERRAEHRAQMQERRGNRGSCDGDGPGRGRGRGNRGGFAEELGLTQEQKQQMCEAQQAHREGMRALMDDYDAGSITLDELSAQAAALRVELEETLTGILGEEAFAALQEKRQGRRQERAENRQERMGQRQGDRLDFLTAVLDLTPDQVASIAAIQEEAQAQRQALHQQIADGTLSPEEAMVARITLRESTHEAILAVLDADQSALFEALLDLRPGPKFGRRH